MALSFVVLSPVTARADCDPAGRDVANRLMTYSGQLGDRNPLRLVLRPSSGGKLEGRYANASSQSDTHLTGKIENQVVRIDIPARRFDQGFPGVTDRFEWFAIRYTGLVAFPTTGTYRFRVLSDDGTKLYIDGQLVLDNDGVHPTTEATGSIDLTAGNHEVVIEYFQGPRYEIALQLYMTVPGGREAIFSLE